MTVLNIFFITCVIHIEIMSKIFIVFIVFGLVIFSLLLLILLVEGIFLMLNSLRKLFLTVIRGHVNKKWNFFAFFWHSDKHLWLDFAQTGPLLFVSIKGSATNSRKTKTDKQSMSFSENSRPLFSTFRKTVEFTGLPNFRFGAKFIH